MSKLKQTINSNSYLKFWWLWPILIGLPYILIQTFYYVHNEQNIYIWDHTRGWEDWFYLVQAIKRSFSYFIWFVYIDALSTIGYNTTSAVLLVPFYYLPFDERINYILAILLVYFLPLVILINYLFLSFNSFWSRKWLLIVAILSLTFTPFWGPSLRGYSDIAGLLPIVIVTIFILSNDLSKNTLKVKNVLIIGVLLWLPFLFKRWYSFIVCSLYITLPLLNLFIFNKFEDIRKTHIINILHVFFYSGLLSLLLVTIFQLQVLENILTINYQYIYSAYQLGFFESCKAFYQNIGLFPIVFALLGIIWAVKGEKTKEKIFVIFCFSNFLINFAGITRVNTPYIHHCLPFSMWLLFISIFGLKVAVDYIKTRKRQNTIIIIYLSLSFLISLSTFNKLNVDKLLSSSLFPAKIYPLHLYNYNNYLTLKEDLKQMMEPEDTISVLASSYILTGQLLRKIPPSLSVMTVPDIDLRDQFSPLIFKAKYIVIADPIQLSAHPDGQRIISIPAKTILDNKNIGHAYERMPQEYILDDNVKAYIFKKVRPFTLEETTAFINQFLEFYPEWKGDLTAAAQEMTTY